MKENFLMRDFFNSNPPLVPFLLKQYRTIAKISPGAYIFQRPFLRGFSMEGSLRFKIDQASLIVGSKFTVFAWFYFVFEGNFQVQAPYKPPGGLIFRRAI